MLLRSAASSQTKQRSEPGTILSVDTHAATRLLTRTCVQVPTVYTQGLLALCLAAARSSLHPFLLNQILSHTTRITVMTVLSHVASSAFWWVCRCTYTAPPIQSGRLLRTGIPSKMQVDKAVLIGARGRHAQSK